MAWALALHGGAGPARGRTYDREEAHMAEVLKRGADMLEEGLSALDVVVSMVRELEDSGFHVAGKGASANGNGEYELDAAVMDGALRRAGAVGALVGFRSPIMAARAVMDETPHVLLVGAWALKRSKTLPLITPQLFVALWSPVSWRMARWVRWRAILQGDWQRPPRLVAC
jgi:beta-aspartyl-peptidase (threonine type)